MVLCSVDYQYLYSPILSLIFADKKSEILETEPEDKRMILYILIVISYRMFKHIGIGKLDKPFLPQFPVFKLVIAFSPKLI